MNDVGSWLENLGLREYERAFSENAISWDLLEELTDEDLKVLGVRALGHRKRMLAAALKSKSLPQATPQVGLVSPNASQRRPVNGVAERRQLTVVFFDLVGSTELSQRLDVEDLREFITEFQNVCTTTVKAHRGYVARYMGDGVLAYFGYPHAGEDDAERAVRAGASLVERLAEQERDVVMSVRVGIATGPVVVGDLIGDGASSESAVIGETPNLAARLQSAAQPNTVLVSELTQVLTRGFFDYDDLGRQALKGFELPQRLFRFTAARVLESRFEARRDRALSEFVGRKSELGLLVDRWESVGDGQGQVVLVGGDAGAGKSRLLEELIMHTRDSARHTLRYHCAPNQINTAYFPFVQQVALAAKFSRDDTPDQKLDKVEALAGEVAPGIELAPVLLATLLTLPMTRYGQHEIRSEKQKSETLHLFETMFDTYARTGRTLVVFEDAHWVDPTSHEVLNMLIAATVRLPMLVVVTHRPAYAPPFGGHGHVTELRLNHLGSSDCMTIIDGLCGRRALPVEVSHEILARTDGVPLFVEELTKTVLSSGMLEARGEAYVSVQSGCDIAIPTTLNDSLMARLDRLASSAREVAQIGACVGREFSYPLIVALSKSPSEQLDPALSELEAHQLIFRRGDPPHASYIFKHALIRDAAAGSLLNKDRRRVHAQIGALLAAEPDNCQSQPELLAHHLTEAGLSADAATYWLLAGEKAAGQHAHVEAIAHLLKALELLGRLPEGDDRDRRELDCQTLLGAVCMLSRGYGDAEGEHAYIRSLQLFDRLSLDNPERRFIVLSGLRHSYANQGQFDRAEAVSRECLQIAEQTQDPSMFREAYYSLGLLHSQRGNFVAGVAQFELGTVYEQMEVCEARVGVLHGTQTQRVAKPPIVELSSPASNHSSGAIALWACGYPNRAIEWCTKVLDYVRLVEQPYLRAYYIATAGFLFQRLRDYDGVLEQATRAGKIARENQLGLLDGWCHAMLGWVSAMTGDAVEGCMWLEKGLAMVERSGSFIDQPWLESMFAEACLQDKRIEVGLAAIVRAERSADRSGIREWEAETRRIKASLLRLAKPHDVDLVEACLRESIEIARGQHARPLELRSTVDLSRLLIDCGRKEEAYTALANIYEWFTEGFDCIDLQQARILLDKLSPPELAVVMSR